MFLGARPTASCDVVPQAIRLCTQRGDGGPTAPDVGLAGARCSCIGSNEQIGLLVRGPRQPLLDGHARRAVVLFEGRNGDGELSFRRDSALEGAGGADRR